MQTSQVDQRAKKSNKQWPFQNCIDIVLIERSGWKTQHLTSHLLSCNVLQSFHRGFSALFFYTIISPSQLLTKNIIKLSFPNILIMRVKLRRRSHESNTRNVKDVCVMASGAEKMSYGTQLPLFICPLAIYLFKVPNNCPIHASHPFQSVC